MTTDELQTRIITRDYNRVAFVDHYDDGEVWLSIQVPGGGANCVLSHEQAREMIAALNRVLEAA